MDGDMMDLVDAILATPLAFRAWLKRQGRMQHVGWSMTSRACPIAIFLGEITGVSWSVEAFWVFHPGAGCGSGFKPPAWVTRFVQEADRRGHHDEVTGKRATVAINRLVASRILNRVAA